MPFLGVNIDHVATLRQARREGTPDLMTAARTALAGGADGITVHLREDRRHIQDQDVAALCKAGDIHVNFEMAATEEMVRIARLVKPASACLVPEKREELTTEGGLDAKGAVSRLRTATKNIKSQGIKVSFFIDADPDQVQAAKTAGADMVELHTGPYARACLGGDSAGELEKLRKAAAAADRLGLRLNAGHGLDIDNVAPVVRLPGLCELNIGFSIVARAVFTGLEAAVREMKGKIMEGVKSER